MKSTFTSLLLLCLSFSGFAQEIPYNTEQTNEYVNDTNHPCITDAEYKLIEQRCAENLKNYHIIQNSLTTTAVSLSWPLKAKSTLTDCSYYHISAYADQNTASGSFQDFNCGNNTYDSHRGTDISIWPLNFYKMDNNLVEVVAAAAGVILDKHDGEFDKNCGSNNLTANYIIIQHSDGSQTNYWHMKKNSLTSKKIGDAVSAGDFLGIVGSSGSSSGPHLHFEVWSGSEVATRVDPFTGTCNSLNSSTWWAAQKTYKETQIVKVSTNTTDVVIPICPGTEVPNETNIFKVPFQGAGLAAGYAKFYIYIRDEVKGLNADLSILNPDGSTFTSWTYSSTADSKTKMWGFSKKLPTTPGVYTFKATYNGKDCLSEFQITTGSGVSTIDSKILLLYPNPSSGTITIEKYNNQTEALDIYGMYGSKVYHTSVTSEKSELQLNLPAGIYI